MPRTNPMRRRLEKEHENLSGMREQLRQQLIAVENQLAVIDRVLNPSTEPESSPESDKKRPKEVPGKI